MELDVFDCTSVVMKLIDRIFDVGEHFLEPRGVKLAIENAEVKLIEEISSLETISPMMKRELLRNWKKLSRENYNKSNILEKAIAHLESEAKPEEVEKDWLSFFFDKARLITDEHVQEHWGRLLAEEVNSPNSISRSLLHSLSIMSNRDIQNFHNLTRFALIDFDNKTQVHLGIFITKNQKAYKDSNITPEIIMELSRLGLVAYNWEDEYIFCEAKKSFQYGNKFVEVINRNKENEIGEKVISIGNVIFTEDGKSLYRIAEKLHNNDILDYIARKWIVRGFEVILNNKRYTI